MRKAVRFGVSLLVILFVSGSGFVAGMSYAVHRKLVDISALFDQSSSDQLMLTVDQLVRVRNDKADGIRVMEFSLASDVRLLSEFEPATPEGQASRSRALSWAKLYFQVHPPDDASQKEKLYKALDSFPLPDGSDRFAKDPGFRPLLENATSTLPKQ